MLFSMDNLGERFGVHHVSRHLLDVDGCRVNGQLFILEVELNIVDRRNSNIEAF